MSLIAKTLGQSWRGRFAFRLATTSFILPEDYLPNVQALAPLFDEVELLFFEAPERSSRARLVQALAAIRQETGIGYNVHLPVDLPVCHAEADERRRAAAAMAEVIAGAVPLEASTLTLHLPYTPADRDPAARRRWLEWVDESLARICALARIPGSRLSVENLDYPLEWLEPLIAKFDLRVCLDIGHLTLAGIEARAAFHRWAQRCALIHLHAAVDNRDHLPLDRLSPAQADGVMEILGEFTGTVSLEVFSLDALHRSVAWLERRFEPAAASIRDAATL